MLGSKDLPVRLGGIYALADLSREHPEDYHTKIMSLLCAFVRHPVGKSIEAALPTRGLTLIAKSSKHENAKQPHWAQARSSCWGTRSPPL